MKEINRQRIIANPAGQTIEVGVIKLFEREGDGGRFYKAFLYENLETVLEQAVQAGQSVGLEFSEF